MWLDLKNASFTYMILSFTEPLFLIIYLNFPLIIMRDVPLAVSYKNVH